MNMNAALLPHSQSTGGRLIRGPVYTRQIFQPKHKLWRHRHDGLCADQRFWTFLYHQFTFSTVRWFVFRPKKIFANDPASQKDNTPFKNEMTRKVIISLLLPRLSQNHTVDLVCLWNTRYRQTLKFEHLNLMQSRAILLPWAMQKTKFQRNVKKKVGIHFNFSCKSRKWYPLK